MCEDFVSISVSVNFSQSFLKKLLSHHPQTKQIESLSPKATSKHCCEYEAFTPENCLAYLKMNKNKQKSLTSVINSSTRLW